MNSISFGAMPVRRIQAKQRPSIKQLSRTDKITRTLKKGMTIDKLPETGFIVGMILPVPFMSVILPAVGIAVKYSYKTYKRLNKKNNTKFNTLI